MFVTFIIIRWCFLNSGLYRDTRAYILDLASRNLVKRNWNNSTLQMFFWYHMTKPRFGQKQKNNYHFQLVVFQGNFFDLKQIPIYVKLLRSKKELNQFTVGFFSDILYVLFKLCLLLHCHNVENLLFYIDVCWHPYHFIKNFHQ